MFYLFIPLASHPYLPPIPRCSEFCSDKRACPVRVLGGRVSVGYFEGIVGQEHTSFHQMQKIVLQNDGPSSSSQKPCMSLAVTLHLHVAPCDFLALIWELHHCHFNLFFSHSSWDQTSLCIRPSHLDFSFFKLPIHVQRTFFCWVSFFLLISCVVWMLIFCSLLETADNFCQFCLWYPLLQAGPSVYPFMSLKKKTTVKKSSLISSYQIFSSCGFCSLLGFTSSLDLYSLCRGSFGHLFCLYGCIDPTFSLYGKLFLQHMP